MQKTLIRKTLMAMALAGIALAGPARTVRVSDFGYDAEDATRFLQAAFDSGADQVVIDARRWVTQPLFGRSDQEIVFENGAVLEAKKGAYFDKNACVLGIVCASNVTVRGTGEIRMHHDDYLKPPYDKSEWRHCITILGSDNVEVRDLILTQGGGDGVYVGGLVNAWGMRFWKVRTMRPYSSNVRLADLYIDTNVRQGMSITSCRGLTAERCVFKNTWGLPPQAGVDLEPNGPNDPITGIVFRDCAFENNKSAGAEFALNHNRPNVSEPFDCLFERCRFVGNPLTVHNTRPDHTETRGRIVVRDCFFVDPRAQALAIAQKPFRAFSFEITGSKIVENGVVTEIDEDWLVGNAPLLASGARVPTVRVKPDFAKLAVVDDAPGALREYKPMILRNSTRLAVYADRARTLTFKGGYTSVGIYAPKNPKLTPMTVEDVDGNRVAEIAMPIHAKGRAPTFSFEAPKAGFYFIRAEVGRMGFTLAAADAPVAVDLTYDWQDLIGSQGTFFFQVPPQAPRFSVLAGGESGECVALTVRDPSGKVVFRHGYLSAWSGPVTDPGAPSGLWSLTLAKPEKGHLEDESVDLIGIPAFLFFDGKRYWK